MLAELHSFERALTEASLSEAIRLLESDRFEELTAAHIRDVGEYRPIQLGEERFFEKAWSRGKEVAKNHAAPDPRQNKCVYVPWRVDQQGQRGHA